MSNALFVRGSDRLANDSVWSGSTDHVLEMSDQCQDVCGMSERRDAASAVNETVAETVNEPVSGSTDVSVEDGNDQSVGRVHGRSVEECESEHVTHLSGGMRASSAGPCDFQKVVNGSDKSVSNDLSLHSIGNDLGGLLPVWSLSSDIESLELARVRLQSFLRDNRLRGDLVFGSHDPHRVGDVDHAVRAKKKPTFSLAAFDEATVEQLRVRAFPRMNEPSITDPLPEMVEAKSPVMFASIDEVINAKAIRLVKAWRASFKKMEAAARKGNWRLAKVRRPPDLWLSEEESTMPAARGLYVDLRPLARGYPAKGFAFGSMDMAAVHTDISATNVELWGKNFVDQALIDEAKRGMSDDSTVPAGTLLCAPHVGALKSFDVAMSKIEKSVTEGWASNYEALPCWPIRCAAYSVVDESAKTGKAKFRLTNDLSWPKPGAIKGVASLNDSMDRSNWSGAKLIKVSQVGEGIAILKASGANVKAWGFDMSAYYRKFGRRPDELWHQAMYGSNGFQLDSRCQFGDASVAVKCSRFSNLIAATIRSRLEAFDLVHASKDASVIEWVKERVAFNASNKDAAGFEPLETSLFVIGVYIDDGAAATIDDLLFDARGNPVTDAAGRQLRRSEAHFKIAVETLAIFGHESAKDKEQPPSQYLESLGLELDLIADRMRLMKRKRKKYAAFAREVAGMTVCDFNTFRSLLGKLSFAAGVYPLARQWTHACWRLAKAKFRLADGRVPISTKVRSELTKWATELEKPDHEGVPLAARSDFPAVGGGDAGAIYCDASGSLGWCAWTVVDTTVYEMCGQWDDSSRNMNIADKEYLASTAGLLGLHPLIESSYIWEWTDNTVALAAIRHLTPSRQVMQELSNFRAEWLRENLVFTVGERITSKNNLWADWGSRGRIDLVQAHAIELGLSVVHVENNAAVTEAFILAERCYTASLEHEKTS